MKDGIKLHYWNCWVQCFLELDTYYRIKISIFQPLLHRNLTILFFLNPSLMNPPTLWKCNSKYLKWPLPCTAAFKGLACGSECQ